MVDETHIAEIEEQAALLALGALPPEEARQFQRRVAAGCPYCCALLQECERTVATLPLLAPEVAPPARLRARLMETIGAAQAPAPASHPPLAGTLVRGGDTPWEAAPIPGVQFRKLYGSKTMLVRMAPQTVYPGHEHQYAEQCLVLEGEVRSQGESASAGDFIYMPKGSTHQPMYTDTGCLLLIAYT